MASLVAAALLPVLILLLFILRKDRCRPEPPGLLLKAFGLGVLSVIPALLLIELFAELSLFSREIASVGDAVWLSFWGAAIPEELAKFFMLWLVLRKNPYFDERMDGIVYAVCVALGFAALENVLYLFSHAEHFMQVGISRALTAVPGHFCDGVLMGYYYSLAHFATSARARNCVLMLAAPVLVHGVYDSLVFASGVSEGGSLLLTALFCVFCYLLWKYASRRMTEHLAADGVMMPPGAFR